LEDRRLTVGLYRLQRIALDSSARKAADFRQGLREAGYVEGQNGARMASYFLRGGLGPCRAGSEAM